MTSPVDEAVGSEYDEKHFAPQYQSGNPNLPHGDSSGENTVFGEPSNGGSNAFPSFDDSATIEKTNTQQHHQYDQHPLQNKRLRLQTETLGFEPSLRSMKSPAQTREEAHRLEDDLRMLQIEQQVSAIAEEKSIPGEGDGLEKTATHHSVRRERSRHSEGVDEFDVATNPLHEATKLYKPPRHPTTALAKFLKVIHQKSFLVRYFTYITPVVLIILVPLLVGALLPQAQGANVGGVGLFWFCIWLEIVWLTLWAGRLLAKALPWPIGLISSLFTDNSKKWRDMVKQLELSATLFFWWLGIEISFLPTMKNHHVDGNTATKPWENILNKILVSIFVCAVLNFAEKIIIQLIAISFHQRTYADRIEVNKFQIASLVKLYAFSKSKLREADSDFEHAEPASGQRTPGQYLSQAQRGTVQAFNKFGDIAGKVAGDFTGRTIKKSNHPSMVILTLLNSTSGGQVLARRLYRTFAREDTETVHQEDLRYAYDNDEECDAAFSMFDKDMNGDISMEELEAVCVEIGRERKAITASLKDLDSVVGKLDDCLVFAIVLISILVFVSLISTSAAGVLTSAGSTVLALSWLLQATAQEFLQSLIFVFVKHPFDVGDRVTVYGNTGTTLKGDDYFVKEISLLYTEFKKMEGHVVQAPNSYLNTLFILNQRRSGGLAEAVPIIWKFGTTLEQIDGVRQKLLDFVKSEKREYQGNILTELRDVTEAHSISLNIIFFFKSSWQNEGLRLQRRNKFICALMIAMQEMGIEGPNLRFPGMRESFPLYMQHIPFSAEQAGRGGNPDNPGGLGPLPTYQQASEVPAFDNVLDSAIPEDFEDPVSPQDRHAPIAASFASQSQQQSDLDRIRSPSGATTSASVHRGAPVSHLRRRGPSIIDTSGRGRGESNARRVRHESIAQVSRRIDLSLGMEGMAAANQAGDVFEDRDRPRVPMSPVSRSRVGGTSMSTQRKASHASVETAHTIDSTIAGNHGRLPFGPGMLNRAGTDGPRSAVPSRRNRFFSGSIRRSHEIDRPERSMTLQFGDDLRNMESGLAGIQEVPTPGYGALSDRRLGYGAFASGNVDHSRVQGSTGHLDPRTGLVSSTAVRMDSNEADNSTNDPETSADGRRLFKAARLTSQDSMEDPQARGLVTGEQVIADLEARARGRGMTNDTVGTGVDPLTTVPQSLRHAGVHHIDHQHLQPTVTTLSQAETEHVSTPVVEKEEPGERLVTGGRHQEDGAEAGDGQRASSLADVGTHTGASEIGDLSRLRQEVRLRGFGRGSS